MSDIEAALAGSADAVEALSVAGERRGAAWSTARAPGKWSPSQIVEHVARALEESAHMAFGRPSKFPRLPSVVHPLVRGVFFNRVLRKGGFPKARTNRAMDPASGPASPAAGRTRLDEAHRKFADACRDVASRGGRLQTTIFGAVAVEDYVRFMEIHTRHHQRQMADDR